MTQSTTERPTASTTAASKTTPNKETLILFDLGAVLVRLNFDRFFAAAARHAKEGIEGREGAATPVKDQLKMRYAKSGLDSGLNSGRLTTAQFCDGLRTIGIDARDAELCALYPLILGAQIDETVGLKRRLHENGYSVGIFSNTSGLIVQVIRQRYPQMLEVYDPNSPAIFSYKVKLVKPDARMFALIKGYRRVIYIDDRDSYVLEGMRAGWQGIHFMAFIDHGEPQRQIGQQHREPAHEPTQGLLVANTFAELEEHLRKLGVKY